MKKLIAAVSLTSLIFSQALAKETIEIGFLTELEAAYQKTDNQNSESDLSVATVIVDAKIAANEQLSAQVSTLYEEDDTDLEIDIAELRYILKNQPLTLKGGQNYLPFGAYQTQLVSDPLTLEMGEARETYAGVEYNVDKISLQAYVFNGDVDETNRDVIDNWGARVDYANNNFLAGISYISNLGDSDTLQDIIGEQVDDKVDGVSVNAAMNIGAITLAAEYVSALDDFVVGNQNFQPSATQVELSLGSELNTKAVNYALSYQTTDESEWVELPNKHISAGMNMELSEHLSAGLEFAKDTFDEADDSKQVIAQLAFEY